MKSRSASNNGNRSLPTTSSPSSMSNKVSRQQGGMIGRLSSSSWSSSQSSPIIWLVVCFLSSLISFYGGVCITWHYMNTSPSSSTTDGSVTLLAAKNKISATLIEELRLEIFQLQSELQYLKIETAATDTQEKQEKQSSDQPFHRDLFDTKHTGKIISGMQTVDRTEFATRFDMGVPLDDSTRGNDQVLLLYSDPRTFPTTATKTTSTSKKMTDVDLATENCDQLNVILTQPNQPQNMRRQCIAIMGQYESYHIQKYMRIPPPTPNGHSGGGVDSTLPLNLVSRGIQMNGRRSAKPPQIKQTQAHWNNLLPYLHSLESVLAELHPLLEQVASHNQPQNTVIVMVCNLGQSELLMNFVCNARAKGFTELLANIILFATDEETLALGEFLGLTTYYSKSIFDAIPKHAAKQYADQTFKKMMAAKVYCVHLCSQLGYNILFQDVDVIWYQNPLTWFHNTTNEYYNYDMYYQDDGNHAAFYAPYSANTGFYFIRSNERTQYFFNALLQNSDLIVASSSHQIALIALLNEHASLYGLAVKIWKRELTEFPGGWNYHHQKSFMKALTKGEVTPYIFHMSWTKNKSDKIKFYEQLGEWYVEKTCVGLSKAELDKTFGTTGTQKKKGDTGATDGGATIQHCCAAKPFVTCHYRDKPSKISCVNSPPIDKHGRSFW